MPDILSCYGRIAPAFALSPHVVLRRELDVPGQDPIERWVRAIFLGISLGVLVSIITFSNF
jgi:hypothetical protein